MKITEIAIFDHKQFKNFVVDLTYPEGHPKAGKPLDKVCFIGSNGTGKTTILKVLKNGVQTNGYEWTNEWNNPKFGKGLLGIVINFQNKVLFRRLRSTGWDDVNFHEINRSIHNPKNFNSPLKEHYSKFENIYSNNLFLGIGKLVDNIKKQSVSIYSPSESFENPSLKISDSFNVSLDEALNLLSKGIQFDNEVSNEKIKDFWKVLTYQVKKREDDYQKYLKQTENRSKTVAEVEAEFDRTYPKILDKIAILWNQILEKAGLEFDAEGANNPIQLTDNLKAYIRLKSSKQPIPYNELSTGIRNFIFKVGHVYSLYFNRNIESGFLMIDEPENSLFPDFLYDIVSIYQEITQNTQIFMATHSPIIAAQFEPCERIILNFDEEGYVIARKGIVPVGDDPNDILVKDFGIRSLLGKEGVEKWERFIELKFLIKAETNITLKAQLINEYMEIGKAYNFGLDLKLKQDEANYQKA